MIQCYGASQILLLERLNAKSAEELAAALPAGLKHRVKEMPGGK